MEYKYSFIDPGAVIGVVVALVILAIGVFAFFIVGEQLIGTLSSSDTLYTPTKMAVYNVTNSGNSVFNIIGVVLIIGAIMSIIGLIYGYIR